ncbi:unnamed protein product [Psylliodes chrysocephalus]|uniref:Uncharacterized protein n=1 Tax=Psylliodes chrysocephalus TaxID=3402493 RepID=A0A9P0DD03_9CUCU|nr:unnamed protein product [Psylliodes chrysocephala]
MQKEKNKWRHISKVIVNAILFCIKNNDALGGTSKIIGNSNCGQFLSSIELISHYDSIIKDHIEAQNKGSVLLKSFIDFINTHEKTGEGLAKEVEEKLITDKLDITNIRGQSYDNCANIAVGVHAIQIDPKMQSFFETVQQIYNFFVGSPFRWGLLKSRLKTYLKGTSDTRWSSKANAVHALNSQLEKVLEEVSASEEGTGNTIVQSKTLLKLIKKIKFPNKKRSMMYLKVLEYFRDCWTK